MDRIEASFICLGSMLSESCAKQVTDIDKNIKNNIFHDTISSRLMFY